MARRRRHQILSAFLLLACAAALPLASPGDGAARALGRGLGYAAFALLTLTLAIGPWAAICRRRIPVSSMARRDVGIWAGVAGGLHALLAWPSPPRGAPGGLPELALLAGDRAVGLVAAVILTGLLLLSNGRALRMLGPRRWKAIQRLNYPLMILAAIHVLAYQAIGGRGDWPSVVVLMLITGLLLLRLVRRLGLRRAPSGWASGSLLPPRPASIHPSIGRVGDLRP